MNFFKVHEIWPTLLRNAPPHIPHAGSYVNLNQLCVAFFPSPFCAEPAVVLNEIYFEPWLVPPLFEPPTKQPRKKAGDQTDDGGEEEYPRIRHLVQLADYTG